jgi:long-chain acyl-CoA synthetase
MYTLADPLERAERQMGEHTAVSSGDRRTSFAELARRCRKLAAALDGLGLERGDRVAILAANSSAYIEVYMGVPAAGYVVVPLNWRHAQPELRYALEDSGTRVLITDRDPGALSEVVEHVISLPEAYEELVDKASERALGDGILEDDLAGLFYTGGTTGASKGVMLSHRALLANALHFNTALPLDPEDVILVMAPMFHAAGSVWIATSIWLGIRQVPVPVFDPKIVLETAASERATVTLGVPTMLAAIAEEQLASPRDVSDLRLIVHGGSPIATEVVRRLHSGIPQAEIAEVYGATEMGPIATVLRHEERLVDAPRGRSCGRAIPGVALRIVDSGWNEVGIGQIGEIVVRGPNVMSAYWNKPEQTAEVMKDAWYRSGDLGYQDDEGFVFLVDRAKDMIVSGGENVYGTEVEEVLYRHPGVLEAAVFGVPDEKWGEAVYAVVVRRPEAADLTSEELIAFCREHLGGYKVPKGVDFQSQELPKSGPGKILKRELRAPYWKDRERQIN